MSADVGLLRGGGMSVLAGLGEWMGDGDEGWGIADEW